MAYDYSKLKGRIREKCDTYENFASIMGISRVALSQKINGKRGFSQNQIDKACELLEIPPDDIANYFFEKKV